MRVLSLFSGIGAHDLGLEWAGMTIVGQVEIDEYCQKILKKHWPKVKRWTDITTVPINDLRRLTPDLITGGFPCQDISVAGKQKGVTEGGKSSLWREMWRIIRDVRPAWVLIENVPALRTNGSDTVLSALEALGYTCEPLVVGAWALGAPHQRNRVWIVGYGESLDINIHLRQRGSHETSRIIADASSELGNTKDERQQIGGGCQAEMKRNSPDLPTQILMYPTPTATEYGSNQGGAAGRVGPKRGSLSQVVQERINSLGKNRERLNPKWVAQLMGLPADWL